SQSPQRLVRTDGLVGRFSISYTKLQRVDERDIIQKMLVFQIPSHRYGRIRMILMPGREYGRCIGTEGRAQDIPIAIRIDQTAHIRQKTILSVRAAPDGRCAA